MKTLSSAWADVSHLQHLGGVVVTGRELENGAVAKSSDGIFYLVNALHAFDAPCANTHLEI